MAFANSAQAIAEDCVAITNFPTANSTLSKQVPMYANGLSTKDSDNATLQTAIKPYRGR